MRRCESDINVRSSRYTFPIRDILFLGNIVFPYMPTGSFISSMYGEEHNV